MKRKKQGKMFGGALFHFEKRQSHKSLKVEKKSEVIFTGKFTAIISISIFTLLISLLKGC